MECKRRKRERDGMLERISLSLSCIFNIIHQGNEWQRFVFSSFLDNMMKIPRYIQTKKITISSHVCRLSTVLDYSST